MIGKRFVHALDKVVSSRCTLALARGKEPVLLFIKLQAAAVLDKTTRAEST